MNPIPELTPHLKQLRLSGILDSLEARNRQAIDSKLAYTEFLALLIQDEIARRDQKKFTMRLRRAAFRTTKTIEQFDFDRLPKLNRALVHDLATPGAIFPNAPPFSLSAMSASARVISPKPSGTAPFVKGSTSYSPPARSSPSASMPPGPPGPTNASSQRSRAYPCWSLTILASNPYVHRQTRTCTISSPSATSGPLPLSPVTLISQNGIRPSPITGSWPQPLWIDCATTRIAWSLRALPVAIQRSLRRVANRPLPAPQNPPILSPTGMPVSPT